MNVTDYLTSWSASYRYDFTENIMPFGCTMALTVSMVGYILALIVMAV